jgi:carboxyl-terminal processing protease
VKSHYKFSVLLAPALLSLASCGGDGGGAGGGGGGLNPPGGNWQSGVFLPSSTFADRCVNPRFGTSDRRGTVLDQNNWLRSWSHELYLWYSEISDVNPAGFNSSLDYFDRLKTEATTASGQAKDKFHFTYDTDDWEQLSQGGTEAGYGAEFALLASRPPRRIVVAFTEPNTTGAANLMRGDEIIQVDGVDAVNGNTQAIVDTLNAGLFPSAPGQSHTFVVRNVAGQQRTVTMVSANITHVAVPIVTTFASSSGPVGYIQFNDHNSTAQAPLISAVNTLRGQNVTDLILDVRYNGGGYLDLAAQLAYMIGNRTLTNGRTFERMVFNDKNPSRNPVTGETLTPTPFHSTTLQYPGPNQPAAGPLPSLDLNRVYVIAGPGTCSASESIINGLRGVSVDVYLVGSTTCGKPYGFYPTDNCGTTYFSIQFRGENAMNFGDYTDGFSPANQPAPRGTVVPGCSVADDFTRPMGDQNEARIAAALAFRASNNQTCPTPSGFAPPGVSKASLFSPGDLDGLEVSKPAARLNRILGRGRDGV